MKKCLNYILILLFFTSVLRAQESARSNVELISETEFEEVVKDVNYEETKSVLKLRERFKKKDVKPEEEIEEELRTRRTITGGGLIIELLAYIAILALVIFIIYLVFSNVEVDKKIDSAVVTFDDIEDIEEIDADEEFKQAMSDGNYRFALRMQFIKVLQQLQTSNQINWRPEKTNRTYVREIKTEKTQREFRKLANIYEQVWYGNTSIDFNTFETLNPSFTQFLNSPIE